MLVSLGVGFQLLRQELGKCLSRYSARSVSILRYCAQTLQMYADQSQMELHFTGQRIVNYTDIISINVLYLIFRPQYNRSEGCYEPNCGALRLSAL